MRKMIGLSTDSSRVTRAAWERSQDIHGCHDRTAVGLQLGAIFDGHRVWEALDSLKKAPPPAKQPRKA